MIRKEYQEIQITKNEKVLISHKIICNKCGNVSENDDFHNKHNIKLGFGYGSDFDMEHWNFDICEECLLDIIKQFKFVPDGFRQDEYLESDENEHQKVFENWKETGEWEEFKYKSYEEIVKLNDGLIDSEYLNEIIKRYHPNKQLMEIVPDQFGDLHEEN